GPANGTGPLAGVWGRGHIRVWLEEVKQGEPFKIIYVIWALYGEWRGLPSHPPAGEFPGTWPPGVPRRGGLVL
ncbi:MAG: hypothetical protein ABSA06_00945, partial [Geobacteraceae bacterium]